MNTAMIEILVAKDWYLQRWTIVGYLLIGAVAIGLLGFGGEGAFYAGTIRLITVLLGLGMHVAMATVVAERTEKTLPFVMSLPISPTEYTTAKIAANLLIFLVPWVVLTIATAVVILGRDDVPDGLLPFTALTLVYIFVSYALVLSAALISESIGWTIGVMVACNLGLQAFLYTVSRLPSIAATIKGQDMVWTPAALSVLAAELLTIAVLVGLTFWLQSRKTDFL